MRRVIYNGKPYDSISSLARAIGYKSKTVWNHLTHGSEIGDTKHCVDYAFSPEEIMQQKQKETKQ